MKDDLMGEVSTIRISNAIAEQIRQHGRETYPNECCGALLGRDGIERLVSHLLPLQNQRKDSPRNRFELTAADVREAEERAKKVGAELLGWYHSHPDASARPSEFDREHAWPWYSYVIVSVKAGRDAEMNSWRLADDRSRYEAEKVEIDATVESRDLKGSQAGTAS